MANELVIKHGVKTGTFRASGNITLDALTNGFLKVNGSGDVSVDSNTYLTTASAASTYQPLDGDLTAIAALAGTSGFLKKTAADTWTLDTATYANTASSYNDPSWITGLAWSKINDKPNTISGYGITDAYTKTEIDNALTGLTWKEAVKAATTADITLSNGQTIDGVAVTTGDRVLVKNQSTSSQNGIYVVNGSGAWTRSTDADSASEVNKITVFVEGGTANGNTQWTQTASVTTLGSDAVTFSQIAGSGTYSAANGVTLTGNQFSAQTQMSITADSSGIKLVNDEASPGNSKYYGTNASGTKGWYDLTGASLTDGDKGDITVSSSGATWTIDNGVVSYAKIQNVSATSRLLGRYSSGAGVIEEISLGTGISLSGGALTLDADLVAIAGLSSTGFLKRTGADAWTLDNSTYLTAESDTLDSVTGRNSVTTNSISIGSLTASGTLTIGPATATVGSKTQALGSGTTVVLSVAKSTFKGMYIDYVVFNGTNQRSGTVVITNDGTSIDFAEMTTNDIGNTGTTDVDAVVNGSNVDFRFITMPDASYTTRIIYRYI